MFNAFLFPLFAVLLLNRLSEKGSVAATVWVRAAASTCSVGESEWLLSKYSNFCKYIRKREREKKKARREREMRMIIFLIFSVFEFGR